MFRPSGSVCSSTTSAPDSLRASGAASVHGAVGAVDGDAQPRQVERDALDDVPDVALDGALDGVGAADLLAAQRDEVVAADVLLDLGLFVVGELEAEVAEELDAVVGEGVVRGRHDDAGVGAALDDQGGEPRRGDDAGDLDRAAAAGDAGDQRRLEHGARDARVAADQKARGRAAMLGQHVGGRAADLQGELGRELLAGQAADAVGAEERHGHDRLRDADGRAARWPCYAGAAHAANARRTARRRGRRAAARPRSGRSAKRTAGRSGSPHADARNAGGECCTGDERVAL